ncbi:MAG: hypothetical protein K5683_07775 [Prevotella sp.]|nr:hypothetical protein [Prevotella sp.]
MASENENNYVTRPRRKPDSTRKGKMNEWSNGYCEFIPQGTRENQREIIKHLGDSSFYMTKGKKESSYSVHLNCDAKSEDPVAELLEQFLHLTEGERKSVPQLPDGSEGRMLLDNGQGLKIWHDRERGKVSILTELNCDLNIDRMLLQAQATMNVTIGRYRQEIVNSNNK